MKNKWNWIVGTTIFVVFCLFFRTLQSEETNLPYMWWSVVPLILAIVLSFITQNVFVSLLVALVLGSLLTTVSDNLFHFRGWVEGLWKSVEIP